MDANNQPIIMDTSTVESTPENEVPDTSTPEHTSTPENEGSEDLNFSSEEDDPNDEDYVEPSPAKKRLRASMLRAPPPGLELYPRKPIKAKKEGKPTPVEEKLWNKQVAKKMKSDSSERDLLAAFMLLACSKPKPWMNSMSLFLLVSSFLGISPFNIVLGMHVVEKPNPTLDRRKLILNHWKVPAITHLNKDGKGWIEATCKQLIEKWDETIDSISKKYSPEAMPNTITLPHASPKGFLKKVLYGRIILHNIWWGHPECFSKDATTIQRVKNEVIAWGVENLLHITSWEKFHAKVKLYCAEGCETHRKNYLKEIRQTELPIQPNNNNNPKPNSDAVDGGSNSNNHPDHPPTPPSPPTPNPDTNAPKDGNISAPTAPTVGDANSNAPTPTTDASVTTDSITTDSIKSPTNANDTKASNKAPTTKQDDIARFLQSSMESKMEDAWNPLEVALSGLHQTSASSIWLHYHSDDTKLHDLSPPKRKRRGVEYKIPSESFIMMASDILRLMNELVLACDGGGLKTKRYHWEYLLLKGINQVGDIMDSQLRVRAMLVCLILSAASTDGSCIKATINLFQKNFLTLDGMAGAKIPEIEACIEGCGLQHKRAHYLQDTFKEICGPHKGVVPDELEALVKLPGVGQKTAILLLNEAYGFFAGIGCDVHVCYTSLALGLFALDDLKEPYAGHVEASLRTWIPQYDYKKVNCTFGSMVQLVTEILDGSIDKKKANQFLACMAKFQGDKYEYEIIWFIIGRILYLLHRNNGTTQQQDSKKKDTTK